MAVDKEKFRKYLQISGAWEGKRCKEARNSDDGDIIAAATTMSVLNYLHHAAQAKVLSHHDIKAFMDSFSATSGMVQVQGPMGETIFQRAGRHPLPKDTTILSIEGERDSEILENGSEAERETGPNALGIIDAAHYHSGEWNYGVYFKESGVYVTITAAELDGAAYEVDPKSTPEKDN